MAGDGAGEEAVTKLLGGLVFDVGEIREADASDVGVEVFTGTGGGVVDFEFLAGVGDAGDRNKVRF